METTIETENIFAKPFIEFKLREDFENVSSWEFTPGDVIDISFSNMTIIFKDNNTLDEWFGCIIWNHIKEENLIIEYI
jgi:hypothetical protein